MIASRAAPNTGGPAASWAEVVQGNAAIGIERLPRLAEPAAAELARGPSRALKMPMTALDEAGLEALCTEFCPSPAAASALHEWLQICIKRLQQLQPGSRQQLRIERLHGPGCPRWHVDHVPLRMLGTLFGPGTEWLPEPVHDRTELLRPGGAQRVDERVIEGLAAGEAALLRGQRHPAHPGLGVIHRSPLATPEQARVLVAVDVMEAEEHRFFATPA